jgi:hypothetical protein
MIAYHDRDRFIADPPSATSPSSAFSRAHLTSAGA